jgi:HK97 gp10 family phage protein
MSGVSGNLLEGFEACFGKLARLGDISAAAEALEAGAALIAGTAKGFAPYDTGYLRNSITYKVSKSESGAIATVKAEAEYAPYVEFGTGTRGAATSKGGASMPTDPNARPSYTPGHNGQAAYPFMYPAFKKHEKEIEKMIIDAVAGAVV